MNWLLFCAALQRRHYIMALERSSFEKRGAGYTNKATVMRWIAHNKIAIIWKVLLESVTGDRLHKWERWILGCQLFTFTIVSNNVKYSLYSGIAGGVLERSRNVLRARSDVSVRIPSFVTPPVWDHACGKWVSWLFKKHWWVRSVSSSSIYRPSGFHRWIWVINYS